MLSSVAQMVALIKVKTRKYSLCKRLMGYCFVK